MNDILIRGMDMPKEYIEREALQRCRFIQDELGEWILAEDIINLPAADVRPVRHGRWVRKVEIDGILKREYFVCSECGQTRMLNFHNYCPNCGADMRAEEGE